MSTELMNALAAVVKRLVDLSVDDPLLRNQLRAVATAFLHATDNGQASVDTNLDLTVFSDSENLAQEAVVPVGDSETEARDESPSKEVLPELTLGSKPSLTEDASESSFPRSRSISPDADLQLIENRCRLKAEGARWAASRQRLVDELANFADEIDPKDREIIARAKALEECFMWMNGRHSPIPPDLEQWEDVAGCFEAVANGIAVIRMIRAEQTGSPALFEKAMDLLAEAQSALRSAVCMIDHDRTDPDQAKIFHWLKMTTTQEHIFIQRFMRADDLADPDTWPQIADRIEAVDTQLRSTRQTKKQQDNRLGRIRYHLKRIQAGKGDDHDWRTVINTVEELVKGGLPPSSVDLRELLVPVIEDMPDFESIPAAMQQVLAEIDRFLASRPTEQEIRPQQQTDAVAKVAEKLNGRTMLMIGGLRRAAAKDALESAFKLKQLIWFDTKEHESVSMFEPYVAQSDVVLLAIRWSSHSYGEVREFCEKHGKIFVRLPGGYNPNQVAVKIIEQANEQMIALPSLPK